MISTNHETEEDKTTTIDTEEYLYKRWVDKQLSSKEACELMENKFIPHEFTKNICAIKQSKSSYEFQFFVKFTEDNKQIVLFKPLPDYIKTKNGMEFLKKSLEKQILSAIFNYIKRRSFMTESEELENIKVLKTEVEDFVNKIGSNYGFNDESDETIKKMNRTISNFLLSNVNFGKKSSQTSPQEKIFQLYTDEKFDFLVNHFCNILQDIEAILKSLNTILPKKLSKGFFNTETKNSSKIQREQEIEGLIFKTLSSTARFFRDPKYGLFSLVLGVKNRVSENNSAEKIKEQSEYRIEANRIMEKCLRIDLDGLYIPSEEQYQNYLESLDGRKQKEELSDRKEKEDFFIIANDNNI